MWHRDIFDQFKEIFPNNAQGVDTWFSNGENSIKIRLHDKSNLIFTYHNKKNWKLETLQFYNFEGGN